MYKSGQCYFWPLANLHMFLDILELRIENKKIYFKPHFYGKLPNLSVKLLRKNICTTLTSRG